MANIVILGSGFAGCTAVKQLRKHGCTDTITVISPQAALFYYPSLIWVPQGRRCEADLRVALTGFFRRNAVRHIAARVTALDPAQQRVHTEAGETPYDYLIIASGGRYLRTLPGIEHAHIACEGWQAVKRFSDRLAGLNGGNLVFGFAGNAQEPPAMRGGPIFEFMFGVDTLLRDQGRRANFHLTFISTAPKPGVRMGNKAVEGILREVDRRGIQRHFGHRLVGIEADQVLTDGGAVPSDLTLFIPALTGPDWAPASGLPLSAGGFIQADAQTRVPGFPGIYVAGDAGSFPGPEWKPKQAHMADQQARCAVSNLLALKAGKPQTHTFKTRLICIVDNGKTGTLVYRDPQRGFASAMPPWHWLKLALEWQYLRTYRRYLA